MNSFRALTLSLAAAILSHCAAPVSVRKERPVAPPGTPSAGQTLDGLVASIHAAHERIRGGDSSAIPGYNHSAARLIESLEHSGADPWGKSITLSGAGNIRSLKGRAPADTSPLHDQLFPTDTLGFRGEYSECRATVSGIGAPVVLVTSFEGLGRTKVRKNLPLRNLTAVVRFEGNVAILELADPYQHETITLAGKTRTLSADYAAAIMLAMSKARVDKLGLVRLLHPSRYDNTANLNFLQPYDPKRIPVLMVHGLDSTPATFAPMYFKLLEDPVIRENYQFWVFSYPSGYPYPYSASLLRRELDQVNRDFPGHQDMVIIGHSMGGTISRLMVTDAGDKLWRTAFGKAPAETPVSGHSRQLLLDALVFDNRGEIDRAIFFSAPHRGSELATHWLGSTFSRLIRMPGFVADVRNAALSIATADQAGLKIQQAPSSIATLSPDNPFVRAINGIPIAPGIPYHTIAGDRGKGDTPNSSDGVVPYWSSHFAGAASEKIVPSGHGSHAHPEGIEEVRRILKLHLKSQ